MANPHTAIISLEHRFEKDLDGHYYGKNSFKTDFWQPYLQKFQHVLVVARVKVVKEVSKGFSLSDGKGISFYDLPYFVGPIQFIMVFRSISKCLDQLVSSYSCHYILRVPSSGVSNILYKKLQHANIPYSIEVVADPYDALSAGTIRSPARRVYQKYLKRKLQEISSHALNASYVTENALQERYPATKAVCKAWYSDVNLNDAYFRKQGHSSEFFDKSPFKIICVGSMSSVLYKGQDTLIKAVCEIKINYQLIFLGDGERREELESLAESLGIKQHVLFEGYVKSGEGITKWLDQCHLFVLPSRQEGLPRALIEAMARGLPCIGSTAGGIPELLPEKYIVAPNNTEALSTLINQVAGNPLELQEMSEQNIIKARNYRQDIMEGKRQDYFSHIIDA